MRFAEDAFGGGPVEAGVGDADAVFEFGAVGDGLVAFFEVAFDHEADEGFVAAGALFDDDAGDFLLLAMLFVGVGVAAIDHEDGILSAFLEGGDGFGDAFGIVIGAGASAAKNYVAEGISFGADDGGEAVLIDTEKTMRGAGGVHGVERDLE